MCVCVCVKKSSACGFDLSSTANCLHIECSMLEGMKSVEKEEGEGKGDGEGWKERGGVGRGE